MIAVVGRFPVGMGVRVPVRVRARKSDDFLAAIIA